MSSVGLSGSFFKISVRNYFKAEDIFLIYPPKDFTLSCFL
nr:MAG TPA: hypothetical protein [Caudoviricetes sp.]